MLCFLLQVCALCTVKCALCTGGRFTAKNSQCPHSAMCEGFLPGNFLGGIHQAALQLSSCEFVLGMELRVGWS